MSCRLTVEQISKCRRGSDIDLEAVFQGHISGKRIQGVKSNPIYHDKQKSADTANVTGEDFNITVYNSFPLKRQRNVDFGEPPFLPSGEENPNFCSMSTVVNKTQEEDMRRENLKVSRVGDVVLGDIIIETDYKNISINEEEVISELEKMAEGMDLGNGDVTNENNNVENLDQKQKAMLLKHELDKIKLKNSQEVNESERKHLWHGHKNSTNGKPPLMNGSLKGGGKSDWPNIDDLVVASEKEMKDTDGNIPNVENVNEAEFEKQEKESLPHEKQNGIISNGKTDSNGLHMNGKIPNGNMAHDVVSHLEEEQESKKLKKSKKNSSKKKIRERKNSLPDHILNSLSMKPKKPILVPTFSDATSNSCSDGNRTNSFITEQKSVKFSKDTVFNENKPNKYRKEKVRDAGRNGNANSNPVFIDDNGLEVSLTDDEKALHFSNTTDTNSQLSDLNIPGYMKEYVIESGDLPPVTTRTALSRAKLGIEDIDTITTDDSYREFDRALAKQHRNKVIRLVLACFVFLVVIAVVVLLVVYFGKPHSQS
ncbi:uncharacterized protein LOC111131344 isoform X3 [Crassostrea virginica]